MTDFIIVGGGAAGCVLANRLSEDPTNSVLLLEAGGKDWHPLIHMPAGFAKMTKGIASWGWSTVPQKHMKDRVFWYTQAKVIGGGSSINAQIYTRGNAADYDGWATEEGCEGWSYREVLPYFKRAEDNQRYANDYHGYGGPLGVSNPISPLPICEAWFRAAQEIGIPFNPDFNGAIQEGVGYYQLTQKHARRSSAAIAYLRPIANRKNLTVRSGVMVTRVVVEKGRAVGVEVVERPGAQPQILRANREVIVSSGAIGSPKLLLQSGIGPADHLKSVGVKPVHDLPGVPLPAGLEDGSRLPEPIFTPATKAELGEHDENVDFATVARTIGEADAESLRALTLEVYSRAERLARERGVILADTKLEFGRDASGTIVLGDEVLTPDSSRFWPADAWAPGGPQPSFDKQFVRDWLTHDSGWDRTSDSPPPPLPVEVVERTRARYLEAFERLTGHPIELP